MRETPMWASRQYRADEALDSLPPDARR